MNGIDAETKSAIARLRVNKDFERFAVVLRTRRASITEKLISSQDAHKTAQLQGHAQALTDVLKLLED